MSVNSSQYEENLRPGVKESRRRVVLAVSLYPEATASLRQRILIFQPSLEDANLELRVWSFLASRHLTQWLSGRRRSQALLTLRCLPRLISLARALRGADVAIVQREALPFGTTLVERAIARRCRFVWDVDDNLWAKRSGLGGWLPRFLRNPEAKYEWLCREAAEVWAGSDILAQWCRTHNDTVRVIPTTVEVPLNRPSQSKSRTVTWIGSPSTEAFVTPVLPHLLAVDPPLVIELVGGFANTNVTPRLVRRPWSLEQEREALSNASVGLYPIDSSHPMAAGKCAFKAILYMAHGIPVVITPTETNCSVVRDGIEGLYATTAEEFANQVARLLADSGLREQLSRNAFKRARTEYSADVWGKVAAGYLTALV